MSEWSGRKVRRLVNLVLHVKGRTCHLCGLGGADSADHDPPRSELVARGVPDPDALEYLWPSHKLPCNIARGARPITAGLRAELRAKRLSSLGQSAADATLSPRFASRRPSFFPTAVEPGRSSCLFSPRPSGKNPEDSP